MIERGPSLDSASATGLPFALHRRSVVMRLWLLRLLVLLGDSINSWFSHRGGSKSAALAFYTLFSMAPILLLAIALAGRILGDDAARGEVLIQIQSLVGPNGALAIQAVLVAAQDRSAGFWATLFAGALLLVAATSVFVELKASLDEIWESASPRYTIFSFSLGFLKTRLLSFGMVLALAFLLLISLVVGAALSMLEPYTYVALNSHSATYVSISSAVSFAVIACLFAVIYKALPDVPLSWRDVWIGAVATAGLFSLGKYLIGLYLGNSGLASSFGAAGSLIALLLWVDYSAQMFFLGAEFTRQYALCWGSLRPCQKAGDDKDISEH